MTETGPILTLQEVADLVQLSPKTVKRAIDAGHLQASQLTQGSGGWRVYRSAVDDWMTARANVQRPIRPLVRGKQVDPEDAIRPVERPRPRRAAQRPVAPPEGGQLSDGRIVLPSRKRES